MFYNNLISIPILIVASFAFEDWGAANLEQNLYFPLPVNLLITALLTNEIVFCLPSSSLGFPLYSSAIPLRGVYALPLQLLIGTCSLPGPSSPLVWPVH